ncbi:glutathione S-transferase N-terminal domain-containing protein [Marinobacter sp.]|uniref:glutathione S-transferase N-terminal domain-containing protein n=1 Tax=Marinobacter sp. TaxID=50741 RepID=UPI003B524FF3
MLKLYGTPPTRALRVVWLLNELGLEYELHPVDLLQGEHLHQDFLSLNPAAKVPVLERHMSEREFIVGGRAQVAGLPQGNVCPAYCSHHHP